MLSDSFERALRRDDLTLSARDVDLVTTLVRSSEPYVRPSVVLVDDTRKDEACLLQALEVFLYDDGIGARYGYVPLMHGPVKEGA